MAPQLEFKLDAQDTDKNTSEAASLPALLEYFAIEGLFGYRTISLSSKFAATIVIARNGAGKTTLLGALDAFLKGQFIRLTDLQFSKIECRLRGVATTLVLLKSDLDEMMQVAESSRPLKYQPQTHAVA